MNVTEEIKRLRKLLDQRDSQFNKMMDAKKLARTLEAENERLREALAPFATAVSFGGRAEETQKFISVFRYADILRARKVFEGKP